MKKVKTSFERKVTARTISPAVLKKRAEEGVLIRLLAQGEVVDAEENKLVFISKTQLSKRKIRTQTFQLKGRWTLSKSSELQFTTSFTKKVLRFRGAWKINKKNELVYEWSGSKKRKNDFVLFQKITFRGTFDFNSKLQLRYKIAKTATTFEFDGKIIFLGQKQGVGTIRYELRATYRKRLVKGAAPTLTLYGSWQPVSRTKIGFRIKFKDGKYYETQLSGAYFTTRKNGIEFKLKQKKGVPSLLLDAAFIQKLPRGEMFLKMETDFNKKHFVGAGARISW